MKTLNACAVALIVVAATASPVRGQDAPAAVTSQPARSAETPLTPLKIQLVLSRTQGDKKISSVPYVLWVTANDRAPSSLRMGNQIPVPDGKGAYTFRDVGTNIDVTASSASGDFYRIALTVNDSSVYFPDRNDPAAASQTNTGIPAFRSVTSRFNILLRDGQTGQYLTATDPMTGQVLKIDATLTVLK